MEINSNYNRLGVNFGKKFNFFKSKLGNLPQDSFVLSQKSQPTVDERLDTVIGKLSKTKCGREDIFSENLKEVVQSGTKNNPQLLEKRTKFLEEFGEKYSGYLDQIAFMNFVKQGCPELAFDNLEQISELFSNADNEIAYMKKEFFGAINEKSVNKMSELKDNDSLTTYQKVSIIMHSAQDHKIEFGDEEVEVDSSEIVSLLTGINSISTQENGNYDEFNAMVESLTEKSHRNGDLTYYKIAEGILTQCPELVEICNMYEEFNEMNSNNSLESDKNFFELLDKTGKLNKKIKLKTIVPDENAMILPSMTTAAFEFKDV